MLTVDDIGSFRYALLKSMPQGTTGDLIDYVCEAATQWVRQEQAEAEAAELEKQES